MLDSKPDIVVEGESRAWMVVAQARPNRRCCVSHDITSSEAKDGRQAGRTTQAAQFQATPTPTQLDSSIYPDAFLLCMLLVPKVSLSEASS